MVHTLIMLMYNLLEKPIGSKVGPAVDVRVTFDGSWTLGKDEDLRQRQSHGQNPDDGNEGSLIN
jgi:hypothetical protein